MIRDRSERQREKIEIDLTGPDGNAYVLMAYAHRWGRQLGYSEHRIKCLIDEMKLTTYDGLLHTFDREFGDYVVLWR